MNPNPQRETLTLGGGCFWCIEAVFEKAEGVEDVVSGYAGGQTASPDYEQVCGGRTGHAEVVQITYDPSVVGVEDLLRLFWKAHDPTTLNRQGADSGTQYRSAVYYSDEKQKAAVVASMAEAQKELRDPIVTEVAPLKIFYPAEEYHQDYFRRNPQASYCALVIKPKLKKLDQSLS